MVRSPLWLPVVALALAGCKPAQTATSPIPVGPPPLAQTQPATVDDLCAEPPRAWSILADGVPVGQTLGGCVERGDDGRAHLLTQLVNDDRVEYELHLWLSANGLPSDAQLRTPTVVTDFHWSDAGLTESRFGDDRTLPARGDQQVWVVPSHAVYVREVMLRLGVGLEDGARLVGYAPDVDAISRLSVELERDDDPSMAEARLGSGVFALRGADHGLAGLKIARVSADDRPLYASLTEAPPLQSVLSDRPEPHYVAATDLSVEPVKIDGEATLAGEVVTANTPTESARPGVLFISGAGPQNRWGIVPSSDRSTAIDLGSHEFHDALAREGFAVLRYDDRGVGESSLGPNPTFGFDAGVDDARRALAVLAKHPGVDPKRLIVIGHGEGALIASLLAQRPPKRADVQGLVLLAAPGRNLRQLVYDQIRHALEGKRSDAEIRMAVDEARRVHEAALADADLPATSEPLRQWMQEVFSYDPAKEIRRLRVPVLALQGGKDFQVNPVSDFELVALAVRESRGGGESRRLANLDYLFKLEPGRSHAGHYRDLSRDVDGQAIESVVSFARQQAQR
jgi:pimeloyl-ACP methyl ester carboxylesterase